MDRETQNGKRPVSTSFETDLRCKKYRHAAVRTQHAKLVQKIRGHYQYHEIAGIGQALSRFMDQVECAWQKWLNRRSERAKMTWECMHGLLKRYPLPLPKIVHSYLHNRITNP